MRKMLFVLTLLLSACGPKSLIQNKATLPEPRSPVTNGCEYRPEYSPAYGPDQSGVNHKYYTYECSNGSFNYCDGGENCFNSTARYF